ncbi:aminotransferase class V-fold PLP-dependent enzyme [Spongiactinospora gelatinilytica]|uniref:aminotransferase class V-fold PLP-dependent enzyme n=1 Tax=Spongiactinospora gelatinilytica TaxID=2666298 RepID=UPI0018F4AF5A|nr:aminotransferase class V-fold PLP-dependent enzyme [Spongiactinospora gelatinilytica]
MVRADALSRRKILQRSAGVGGALALGPLLSPAAEAAAAAHAVPAGAAAAKDLYRAIGVRPLINARGTFTILSGSLMLPQVREAIDQASRQYVHLDELADAVGRRLAELTKAEFGLVSSGCAAAMTHATAACVAGGNPDLHVRIPDLTGFQKTEVIIPKHSRNVYEAAISAVGVKIVEVSTRQELEAAIGPQTALVYIMAGPRVDKSELNTKVIAEVAKPRGVPVLVDAAAEILTIPNVHLGHGADLVAYSGGKAIRGPQSAGLLLGREDLVRAAWVHSAPHHGFARGFKVGKEEAMGMLMAVEMWVRRDHDAEYARWESWLRYIARRVSSVQGVTTEVVQPEGLSNRTPSLRILWEEKRLGVSGKTVMDTLYADEPRIALNQTGGSGRTGVSITPYMLSPGDEKAIARRLVEVLRDPPAPPEPPKPPSVQVGGTWAVKIQYLAGSSTAHRLQLTQSGDKVTGSHTGEFVTRELTGTVSGDTVRLRSVYPESHGDALDFTFTGTVAGGSMRGDLDMGEYLKATWTATRAG